MQLYRDVGMPLRRREKIRLETNREKDLAGLERRRDLGVGRAGSMQLRQERRDGGRRSGIGRALQQQLFPVRVLGRIEELHGEHPEGRIVDERRRHGARCMARGIADPRPLVRVTRRRHLPVCGDLERAERSFHAQGARGHIDAPDVGRHAALERRPRDRVTARREPVSIQKFVQLVVHRGQAPTHVVIPERARPGGQRKRLPGPQVRIAHRSSPS